MRRSPLTPLLILVLLLTTSAAFAAGPLEKRTRIDLGGGTWMRSSETKVSAGISGVETSTDAVGGLGFVGVGHWMRENLCLMFDASFRGISIESDVGALGVTSQTAIIGAIQFGARWYVPAPPLDASWRPYLYGTVGPVTGTISKTEVGGLGVVTEERTEYAFGATVGVGIDVQLGRLFMIGMRTGFAGQTDFGEPIAGRINHSGGLFALNVSLLLGRGVDR